MGTVYVTVEIGDPHGQESRPAEMEADTGFTYTAVPRRVLEDLGVVVRWVEPSMLADGSTQNLDVGQTTIRLGGKEFSTMVSFAEDHEPSLLGVTALEQALLAVDPVHGRLIPVPARRYWRDGRAKSQ